MMRTRCEARGEEGHMLGAGRCEGYAGGTGGVGMQANAERSTVELVHPQESPSSRERRQMGVSLFALSF